MAKKLVQITYVVNNTALLNTEKALKDNEAAAKKANQQINKFGKDAGKAGDMASKSFLNLGAVWKSIIAIGIVSFIGNLAKKTFELGVKQEQLNIAFATFLGSAEKAKKLIQELTKFAIVTPFTTDQVNNAAKALLAFGVAGRDIIPTLKMLGDVSSGTGKDLTEMAIIFGQIRSTGRLMGQDLLQLINAGFNPLQIISEKTGKSVGTLKAEMEKGLITFEMVSDAFKSATSEGGRFFNLMEKQSQSVGGLLSTIEGNIDEILKNLFTQSSGPVKEFVDQLVKLTEGFLQLSLSADQAQDKLNAGIREDFKKTFEEFAKGTSSVNEAAEIMRKTILENLAIAEEEHAAALKSNNDTQEEQKSRLALLNARRQELIAIDEVLKAIEEERQAKENAELAKKLDAEAKAAAASAKAMAKLTEEYRKNAEEVMKRPVIETDITEGFGIDNLLNAAGFLSPEQRKMLEDDTKETLKEIENATQTSQQNNVNAVTAATQKIDDIRAQSFQYAISLLGQLGNALISEGENEVQAINDRYDAMEERARDAQEEQLSIAGDNARAREQIQVEADRKEKEREKQKELELDAARKRQAEKEKEIAIKRMIVENVLNAVKALGTPPVPNFAAAGLALAYGAGSIVIAEAVGFKDGVIGLQGPGTTTSDSIPARLSRGESVINAEATSKSRSLLEAINEKKLDDRVLRKLAINGGSTSVSSFDDSRMVKELQQMNGTDYFERGHRIIKKIRKGETLTEYVHSKYH